MSEVEDKINLNNSSGNDGTTTTTTQEKTTSRLSFRNLSKRLSFTRPKSFHVKSTSLSYPEELNREFGDVSLKGDEEGREEEQGNKSPKTMRKESKSPEYNFCSVADKVVDI